MVVEQELELEMVHQEQLTQAVEVEEQVLKIQVDPADRE